MLSKLLFIRSCKSAVIQPVKSGPQSSIRCVRSFRQKPRTGFKEKPDSTETAAEIKESSGRYLVRPFFFTVAFTGVSFAGTSIWQYESVRKRVIEMRESQSPFRDQFQEKAFAFRRRWNYLYEEAKKKYSRPGELMIVHIILSNISIWIMWKATATQLFSVFRPIMNELYMCSPFGRTPCISMIMSVFSHQALVHLFVNMFVLHSLSTPAINTLGKEQTLGVYLSAGVIAAFSSYVNKVARMSMVPSLGASGAIFALLAIVCSTNPEGRLSIIGLDHIYPHSFSAGSGLKAIMLFDALGVLLGWRLFDHAAHLGGAIFGLWYVKYGHKLIWDKRERFVRQWHKFRGDIHR